MVNYRMLTVSISCPISEAVVNVAGCLILKQTGTGTYSVNSNGTGRAEIQVTLEPVSTVESDLCSILDQELLAGNSKYTSEFAINADGA